MMMIRRLSEAGGALHDHTPSPPHPAPSPPHPSLLLRLQSDLCLHSAHPLTRPVKRNRSYGVTSVIYGPVSIRL